MTDTATVEVLTAEVRVLMVGSRQITLSVVRQLDEVEPADIRPFGRVRAARKPDDGVIEVVGSADGVLAYAVARMDKRRCTMSAFGSGISNWQTRCNDHHNLVARLLATSSGLDDYDRGYLNVGAGYGHDHAINREHHWKDHVWLEFSPDRELYDEWGALPLIVLAGLR